ncbi:MAG: T9SS type A sorting domain-containing protein [Candidatus Marinimicrobia bacterium]|jgi:hypothetical protein|nr:T9SS type A sorting domain-containing protein [Candidatus Neomarinimicrobiota bacterium]MBT3617913.1 T9SS type A sorting domain-containing protein [Candidatus Neomarinimicrobiota bacterium]MBT3828750.1 T9SS type A sorting domain-containing protein [Candidatus Neomarinimicrobiota bacterium]MBT3997041.1 T9SS type A sorting domain-containing protein [Candidatus Neomarinimicrobiota bacterium]MBT4280797.1 T9SS type A sorting domain-containing protein [Candidatus Neomarinimicrobiota bacterium]
MKKTLSALLFSLVLCTAQSNVDYTTEVYPIFSSAGCLSGYCHGSGGSSGGLTIGSDATTVYSNIVGVASSCNNLNYIEPGDPNTSHLYLKCTTSYSCGGNRMPRNNQSYFTTNANELETMRVWIEEGALAQPAQITDSTPPTLVNITIAQDTLDLINGPDSVSITLIASDAGSGLNSGTGKLLHSNNIDEVLFTVAFTQGDSLDTVAFDIVMSDTSTLGNWYISFIQLTDVDGNDTTYTSNDFTTAGFEVGFVLINSTLVSIQPDHKISPGNFTLFPNYPNPFNPTTTIRFNIGVGGAIMRHPTLTIFDINGRVVDVLLDGPIEPGQHEIQWNASAIPSGVYFMHLISGNQAQSQKLIFLK